MTDVQFEGPAGAIEGVLGGVADARRIAVICHPHPLHGGTMGNKVVTMLERTLGDLQCATLRFNFRGVGRSAGTFDEGRGEQADLAAAVAFLRVRHPALPLWLAGFSFGAFVSACAADALGAECLISVAPPVKRFGFSFPARPQARWIVAMGDRDEVVAPADVDQFFAAIQPPVDMLRFEGAGHFFHGRLVELRERLKSLLG
jgi:hypothetical protein